MAKKLPYGVQNFQDLIEQNYYYVDKTQFITKLENLGEKYSVLLRPRKFGKSLWINTLSQYYDILQKDKFKQLFGDLYIGKNPTKRKNSYYILQFNFSGIQTRNKEILIRDFRKSVSLKLKGFLNYYQLEPIQFNETDEPATLLREFFHKLIDYNLSNKIYLMIDEYDHFANELLSFKQELFKEVVSRTGFVRKFYEVIKEGASDIVDRIFITGVSPVTLDSFTSGFNIGKNITLDPYFNEALGFTEEEVKCLVKDSGYDLDIAELRKYYNGYKFSEDADKKVYNSDMILYFLTEYSRRKKAPKEILDTNITSDYRKLQDLIGYSDYRDEVLEKIVSEEQLLVKLTREFNLEREQTKDDLISILFYLGFLTIEGSVLNLMKLQVPNYAIKLLYFEYFNYLIETRLPKKQQLSEKVRDSLSHLALNGEIENLVQLVESVIKNLSNRDFIRMNEKSLKMVFMTYLMMLELYYVKSEYETGQGYVDILLLKKHPDVVYEGMIELKYIKKADYNAQKLEKAIEEGKKQLQKYQSRDQFIGKSKFKCWLAIFVGEEAKIIMLV